MRKKIRNFTAKIWYFGRKVERKNILVSQATFQLKPRYTEVKDSFTQRKPALNTAVNQTPANEKAEVASTTVTL